MGPRQSTDGARAATIRRPHAPRPVRRAPFARAVLVVLAFVVPVGGRADAPDEATPPADSRWIGRWLLHEPDHGSYQATEYRFDADGSLRLVASVDTNAHGDTPHRLLGVVRQGRRVCVFGSRWAPDPRPNRVRIALECSDHRARTLVLELHARAFESTFPAAEPHVVSVDGRRGFRLAHVFGLEMRRCAQDPANPCLATNQGRARAYPPGSEPLLERLRARERPTSTPDR